jgi:hypothetical protein
MRDQVEAGKDRDQADPADSTDTYVPSGTVR